MGTIDKLTYTLTCADCGVEESASILDKGSGWGGSDWQGSANFKSFKTSWKGGAWEEPTLISAVCAACGGEATANSRYGS